MASLFTYENCKKSIYTLENILGFILFSCVLSILCLKLSEFVIHNMKSKSHFKFMKSNWLLGQTKTWDTFMPQFLMFGFLKCLNKIWNFKLIKSNWPLGQTKTWDIRLDVLHRWASGWSKWLSVDHKRCQSFEETWTQKIWKF